MKHTECWMHITEANACRRIGECDIRRTTWYEVDAIVRKCTENLDKIITCDERWWHMQELEVMSMFRGKTRVHTRIMQMVSFCKYSYAMWWGRRQIHVVEIRESNQMSNFNIAGEYRAGRQACNVRSKWRTMSCSTMRENRMKWNNGHHYEQTADEMIRLMSLSEFLQETRRELIENVSCLLLCVHISPDCVFVCECVRIRATRQRANDILKRNIMTNQAILICIRLWLLASQAVELSRRRVLQQFEALSSSFHSHFLFPFRLRQIVIDARARARDRPNVIRNH